MPEISQNILLAAVFALLIWAGFLQLQLFLLRRRLNRIFAGGRAADLEEIISRQIKQLRASQKEIREIKKFTEYLEKMCLAGLQKVSVIRFNPFKDTGGNQSFTACLLDAKNNGVIISSLFTRDGNRLFAKPVKGGQPDFPLTQEEQKALKEATKK